MVKRINISASNVLYEDKVKDMIYHRQLNLFTNHQNINQKDEKEALEKEKNLQKALERVITRIEGSYALCIVSTIEPDKVFIAKKDSPLVIGKTADASVAASDIPAILDYTKDVYFLEDYEIAILNKGNVSFFDQYGNPIEKEITTIPYDNEAAQKGGYDTFMSKKFMNNHMLLLKL